MQSENYWNTMVELLREKSRNREIEKQYLSWKGFHNIDRLDKLGPSPWCKKVIFIISSACFPLEFSLPYWNL